MTTESNDSGMNRRQLLGTVGAVAVGGMVAAQALADEPAGKGEDRASGIKITGLRAFVVGPKAYFKIETNQKIVGWGEVTGLDPKVSCALAESLFELLDGENPTRV